MAYVPPFDLIKSSVNISATRGELRVSLSYEQFVDVLKRLLISVPVDEEWYLSNNQDVASAIKTGEIKSARQHFVENGYFEGRLPGPIKVDEKWYFKEYPDVADAVRRGVDSSAQAHFDRDGYREGRLPYPL